MYVITLPLLHYTALLAAGGLQACIHSLEEALECCERIGYPVMLKASWGGGGKGIRKARFHHHYQHHQHHQQQQQRQQQLALPWHKRSIPLSCARSIVATHAATHRQAPALCRAACTPVLLACILCAFLPPATKPSL